MDDILIYSKTWEEHMQLLQQFFDILKQHQFYIKLSKCTFAQEEVEYLGHCIQGKAYPLKNQKFLLLNNGHNL